jgi:hypothetical protein
MSRVSQSIFVLEDRQSEILFDYVDLSFLDMKTYKIPSLFNFCCCLNEYESVFPYSSNSKDIKDIKDKLTEWVYELSLSYIRQSGIDCHKLYLSTIECMRSSQEIILNNSKAATVVFHFNNKRDKCYVTTHKDKLNYSIDDKKYIIVIFERL